MDTAILVFTSVLIGYWLAGKLGIGKKKKVMVVESETPAVTRPVNTPALNWSQEDLKKIADAFAAIQKEIENVETKVCDSDDNYKDDDALIKELVSDVLPTTTIAADIPVNNSINIDDIKEALRKLGYKKVNISKAIDTIMLNRGSDKFTAEEIIKQAIQIMNR